MKNCSLKLRVYHANSVSAYTEAEQLSRDNDNEQSSGSTGSLGGSAPVEIDFTAWITDAVVFKDGRLREILSLI